MKYRLGHLPKDVTESLKGIGIVAIVLHNFFHVVPPIVGENEFSFAPETFQAFAGSLLGNPFDLLRLGFSYFGHYGVHIFVFLSAYGLSRKYRSESLPFVPFLKDRFERVYPRFVLCLALFVALKLASSALWARPTDLAWDGLAWKLLLVSNFVPGQAMYPSGPWWFIPFIMQFYLLFPLLLLGYRRLGNPLLLAVAALSILGESMLNPTLIAHGLNINHTVFGHLPVICLGVLMANQEALDVRLRYVAIALLLFAAGNLYPYAWLVSDLSFTVLFLALSILVLNRPSGRGPWAASSVFFGALSFHLFLVGGFLRPPFVRFAEAHGVWWVDNVAALAALCFSTACAYGLRWLDDRLRTAYAKASPS